MSAGIGPSAAGPAPEPGSPVPLAQARAALARVRPRVAEFVRLRADLAELRADLDAGGGSALGGRAELKALEARLHAVLEHFAAAGAQVRGFAPLLLDWPGERDGRPVFWCWLEGDDTIDWYHRLECGFPGRRPVDEAARDTSGQARP